MTFETCTYAIPLSVATIAADQAQLDHDQTNLDYCTLRSPIKGTVIDRRVNVGQTVVSAMSTSSTFLIAQDLRRLQIWGSVNEADVGQIHQGQKVTFTVDAFAGETFYGVVSQKRLNATMTQNVVTYTIVVITDNSNGRLMPYLTTNLKFEIQRDENVLQVPSMALKWHPASWKPGRHGAGREQASEAAAGASPGESGGKARPETAEAPKAGQQKPRPDGQQKPPDKDKEHVEHGGVWVPTSRGPSRGESGSRWASATGCPPKSARRT